MKLFLVYMLVFTLLNSNKIHSHCITDQHVGNSSAIEFTAVYNTHESLVKATGEGVYSPAITYVSYQNSKGPVAPIIASLEVTGSRAFYVDNAASGTYNGRSWTNAWNPVDGWDSTASNPNGINWSILQPGDTLYISGGTTSKNYTSSSYLLPKANGSYADYLVIIKGQDSEHNGTPIIDRIGAMNGSSSPGHASDSSLIHNYCIEFNGFQVTRYIAHQDEVQTNNFVPNGYHLRFKNISCDDVYEDKFFDFTGHPRYIEFINCYLRQRANPGKQADLIWIRGDADYAGGGLYADSIFIIGNTLISNNQATSPHSDGFQYVSVSNVWTEGNKFYTANTKLDNSQTWYGNGYSGKAWFLNNVFYVNSQGQDTHIQLNPSYIVAGSVDSVYWVDNTVVVHLITDRAPYIINGTGGTNSFDYVIKNNIAVGYGNTTAVGHFESPGSLAMSYNQWYNPGQSTVCWYGGSSRTFSYMNTLSGGTSLNSQPSFVNFDWAYSKTLATYEAYDFNITTPIAGTAFTTSAGGHTYTSDGKIGALIPHISDPTDISDAYNFTVIKDFNLYQNYPNPFNPTTTIRYQILKESKVVIKIYNVLGVEVFELLNEKKDAGIYEIVFNATKLSSGTYIYRIIAGTFVQTRKMILLK